MRPTKPRLIASESHEQLRLVEGFRFAVEKHAGQPRKGRPEIPYVNHLLQVAGLVLEHGGDVDQAVAGLLHDVVEDCGVALEVLRHDFGPEVARIVQACTDTAAGDNPARKGPWKERKTRYLEHLREADAAVLLVAACDKLDNLRSLLADLHADGPETLERFNATPQQTLWYYRSVSRIMQGRVPARLECELEALTGKLAGFVGASS